MIPHWVRRVLKTTSARGVEEGRFPSSLLWCSQEFDAADRRSKEKTNIEMKFLTFLFILFNCGDGFSVIPKYHNNRIQRHRTKNKKGFNENPSESRPDVAIFDTLSNLKFGPTPFSVDALDAPYSSSLNKISCFFVDAFWLGE